MVKVYECLSHGFKSDHKVSLLLESPLVFALIPDFFPLVEVMNLVFEITSWNISVDFGIIVHWFRLMVLMVTVVVRLRVRVVVRRFALVVVRRLALVVVGRLSFVVVDIMFVVVIIMIGGVVILAAEIRIVVIVVGIGIGVVVIMWLVVDDIVV